MATVALKAEWACFTVGCEAGGMGTPVEVDRLADRHTRLTGHATLTRISPKEDGDE